MGQIFDNLNAQVGIVETVEEQETFPVATKELKQSVLAMHKNTDVALARQTLVDLIAKGVDLLDESITIAKESQSPRATEVSANLIKTVADIAKEVIAIHEDKGGSSSGDNKELPTNATQNNFYIGTTTDLQKMIDDIK